mgnify:CR=1 FL=1
MTRIKDLLAWGVGELTAAPAGDARLLLQHILQVNHAYLVAHDQDVLPAEQAKRFRQLIARAKAGEPVPYIIGQAPFFGREFVVSPAVLIPRPETEELVQHALRWLDEHPGSRVVDVGTGSGCIAVTLAGERPGLEVAAVDISAAALAVAQENAHRHGVLQRVHFYQGHLLQPLPAAVDLIVANLPYIGTGEWPGLVESVKHYEPQVALQAGEDGLLLIRELLRQVQTKLRLAGAILLEIGWQQGAVVLALAREHFPAGEIQLHQDLAGLDRFVTIQL